MKKLVFILLLSGLFSCGGNDQKEITGNSDFLSKAVDSVRIADTLLMKLKQDTINKQDTVK